MMRDLYVRLFSSGETMGTDQLEEPQPPLEQKNGQRRMEKKASALNKNSPGNMSLPSAILFEISSKMTIFETTGQTPNIQSCVNPSSNFC